MVTEEEKKIRIEKELKKVKKYYGEKMMYFCRTNFQVLLETENLLYNTLEQCFYSSKTLYEDIIKEKKEKEFIDYIISNAIKEKKELAATDKTPAQLLDEKGYILYQCQTENDIQYFKQYYHSGEELCTFNGNRLDSCHVFFAVKKDINQIKRENFEHPVRQDEYGTSVISIQFTRGETNTLSIKNRYNHTVPNPDATFSNNLENIIPGLTTSFAKNYGFNINQNDKGEFDLPNYVQASDGKIYKYNYEINNIYYCPNNVIIQDGETIKYDSEKFIIADYFKINLKGKKIRLYDDRIEDCFPEGLKNIEKIEVDRNEQLKEMGIEKRVSIKLIPKGWASIFLDKENKIIFYINNNIEKIGDGFLEYNNSMEEIEINRVKKIGNFFLYRNKTLTYLDISSVEQIGYFGLRYNQVLKQIEKPDNTKLPATFLENYVGRSTIKGIMPSWITEAKSREY